MKIIDALLPLIPKNKIWHTPIPGVVIQHTDHPMPLKNTILDPRICIVLQGERKICIGEQCIRFNNQHFMFCPINVPLSVEVTQASPETPYLMITMKIDLKMVKDILPYITNSSIKNQKKSVSFLQCQLENCLIEHFEHLVNLLKSPEDIEFLAPLIQQQIYYLLLKSEQGQKLRELVSEGTHAQHIAKIIHWIEQHYNETLRIEDLAKQAGMSTSSFYQHFKKIANISPLQYQKSYRLLVAQKLIKAKQSNIANIAFQVGYESPSQFSREYKKYFGVSPKNDN